jgi:hypothetical protein
MEFGKFHFGRIEIDGVTYERDVVIDRGTIRRRTKKPSKRFRETSPPDQYALQNSLVRGNSSIVLRSRITP